MRILRSFAFVALAGLPPTTAGADVPRVPATPAGVQDVVYAAPFVLKEGYRSDWRRERPLVRQGHLVVLRVSPDFVFPRQTAEPVLYAGDETVERINVGYTSGYVVGIVPGNTALGLIPIWFGAPRLPESVDASMVRIEQSRARAAGIQPVSPDRIRLALRKSLELGNKSDLLREAGMLVQLYAPDERELATTLTRSGN
jgi:hypothetical protein